MKLDKKKLEIVLAKSGLKLEEISKKTSISMPTIRNMLSDKQENETRFSTVNKFAKGLNVDIEALV